MKQTYTSQEKRLIEVLHVGSDNPITGSEIEKLTGIDTREIKKMKRPLAGKGVPIGSNRHKPYGYFIIENNDEMNRYLASLSSQRQEMEKTMLAYMKCNVGR